MALNWKVAAAGGAALGLGLGGLTLAGADDPETQPVRDINLQSARDSISSLSSPIKVTTTTRPDDSPVPPPPPAAAASVSASSPVAVAPAPAPAPPPAPDDSASPVQPRSSGGDSASGASASGASASGASASAASS